MAEARVIALVSDLIFRSRIKEAAASHAVSLEFARNLAQFEQALNAQTEPANPPVLILDLNITSTDPFEALKLARAILPGASIFAYFSHVDDALGERASSLGANHVLPRSKFAGTLDKILSK